MNAALRQIVEAARAANACMPGLEEIEKFETVDEALASEHGPLLAALYAMKVIKQPVPGWEGVIQRNQYAWAAYRTMFGVN